MEEHGNTAHINMNENHIGPIMGNGGDGGTAVLPLASQEDGDAVGRLAVPSSAPPET